MITAAAAATGLADVMQSKRLLNEVAVLTEWCDIDPAYALDRAVRNTELFAVVQGEALAGYVTPTLLGLLRRLLQGRLGRQQSALSELPQPPTTAATDPCCVRNDSQPQETQTMTTTHEIRDDIRAKAAKLDRIETLEDILDRSQEIEFIDNPAGALQDMLEDSDMNELLQDAIPADTVGNIIDEMCANARREIAELRAALGLPAEPEAVDAVNSDEAISTDTAATA